MGNMKFKVGDRVRIKSIDWYNEHKDETDDIECSNNIWFYKEMSKFCGKVMTISHVRVDHYTMVEEAGYWTDEMIECKVGQVEEESNIDLTVKGEETKERIEITIPEGYEYVIEFGKIIFTKKKKEYPKTYEECAEVLGECAIMTHGYKRDVLNALQKLIVCRDAYWKIAGEKMGLDGPWEPDWENSEERRYSIVNIEGDINLPEKTLTKWILKVTNKILVFPTEEMRDAFYENFKELINECKELL